MKISDLIAIKFYFGFENGVRTDPRRGFMQYFRRE